MKELEEANGVLSRGIFAVVLAYALVASLWVLLSDHALGLLFSDQAALVQASVVKGWFFVAITTALLYFLVHRLLRNIQNTHHREVAALEARQKALDLLTAIVESSEDAIFAKDLQGRYLLFNSAAAKALGKTAGEVIGHDDRDVFPVNQANDMMSIGQRVLATGQTETNEIVLDTPSGRRTFMSTKGPLRDASQRMIGIIGISRDITERKQDEDRLRLWAEAFSRSGLAAAIAGPLDNTFLSVNAAFAHERGYAPEELAGKPIMAVYPPELVAEVKEKIAALDITGHGTFETEHVGKDGRRFPVLMDVTVLKSDAGKPLLRVAYAVNIAARQAAEREMQARNAELERFNGVATKRELRMIALKHEVNAMACELGRPAPYDLSFAGELGEKKTL